MAFGSIPKLPFALPNIAAQNQYSTPQGEDRLLQFDDLDLWLQPDLGNARRDGDVLSIMGRKGQVARAKTDAISVGVGMANGIATVNFPGGAISNQLPLTVQNYRIQGSYFVAMIFRWDASVALSGVAYQLFNCGITDGDDVELYMLNDALYLRHGANQNATSGQKFAVDTSFLVWVSYDSETDRAEYGINSVDPETWTSEQLTGAPNCQRDLVIGGKLNAAGTGASQMMHGQMRAFWAGPVNWATPDKDSIRRAFLSEIANLYADDVTLS